MAQQEGSDGRAPESNSMAPESGEAVDALLAKVQQLAAQQRYTACLALLDSAAQPGGPGAAASLQQQRLICSILLHAQREDWWQVLGLPPSSEESKVRAQLRSLARRVHPDKCSLPGAEAAFKALCLAAARASGEAGGLDKGQGCGGAKWWEAWDDGGRGAARKRKRAEESVPDEAELAWREQLAQWALQELREEVRRLQNTLLAKPDGDNPLTLHQKQQRLRHARTVLAERLDAEDSAPVAAGGF